MRPLTVLCAVSAVGAACAPVATTKPTTFDRVAVAAVLEKQVADWNRGDAAAYMEGYLHDPTFIFTTAGQTRTWDEMLARYQKALADKANVGTLSYETVAVQPVGADGAVVLGKFRLSDSPLAGSGTFTMVFERRAEGWRIIHEHMTRDAK